MSSPLPLLLLPGLLCDAALWQNQINYLKDIAECITTNTTQHDSIEAIAQDVLQKAPPRFALAGLSMGGYVALEIMRQAPERVIKLAILDSSARPDTLQQKERRRLLLVMARSGQFKGVTPRLLPLLIHHDRLNDKGLTQIIMDMAERVGRDAFANQQIAILNRADSRPFLQNITCPTLLIGGKQDALTPPELLQELANGIKGSRLKLIEHCGHLSCLEQGPIVNEFMKQWLTS